ncbi:hypothetical protein [Haloparvum sedimenti]|uniref:hypothetical protein n=1 Tax=Haloparvum sedimenti TaxID=1678448 RepID=UPI00071E9228|nr:hypothetical protein [Haloparvum sedimenti]
MRRRALLATVGGSLALAGCAADAPTGSDAADGTDTSTATGPGSEPTDAAGSGLPDDCPTTRGYDAGFPPDADDPAAVEGFVAAYEVAHLNATAVNHDADEVGRVSPRVEESAAADEHHSAGAGWTVTVETTWYEERTVETELVAAPSEAPADADPLPVDDLPDELDTLPGVVREAAASGETIERRLFDDSEAVREALDGAPEQDGTRFLDADGTTVGVTLREVVEHADNAVRAHYLLTPHLLRRAEGYGDDVDPREGDLLECRP